MYMWHSCIEKYTCWPYLGFVSNTAFFFHSDEICRSSKWKWKTDLICSRVNEIDMLLLWASTVYKYIAIAFRVVYANQWFSVVLFACLLTCRTQEMSKRRRRKKNPKFRLDFKRKFHFAIHSEYGSNDSKYYALFTWQYLPADYVGKYAIRIWAEGAMRWDGIQLPRSMPCTIPCQII